MRQARTGDERQRRPDRISALRSVLTALLQHGIAQELVAVARFQSRARRAFAQHPEPQFGSGRALPPYAAEQVGQPFGLAADLDNDVARQHAGCSAGPSVRRRPTTSRRRLRRCTCRATAAAARQRPRDSRSARIGSSRSIGTNMLPCTALCRASCTRSEPRASRWPSDADQRRAAPLRVGRRREDRLVEHVFPVAGELALGEDLRLERVRAAAVAATITFSPAAVEVLPRAIAGTPSCPAAHQPEAGREVVGEREAHHHGPLLVVSQIVWLR